MIRNGRKFYLSRKRDTQQFWRFSGPFPGMITPTPCLASATREPQGKSENDAYAGSNERVEKIEDWAQWQQKSQTDATNKII
jgi:hypothetical protein